MSAVPPCVLFEDDDLLVVDKPPGLNTHKPSPFANDGLYDWLRDREPRWAELSTIHRLDKDTSGLIVFGKTRAANVSLSRQFESRSIRKSYLCLAARQPNSPNLTVESKLVRNGSRYHSAPNGDSAVTHFQTLNPHTQGWLIEARPETGRTHQIRVHAAESGFPILGDTVYGGHPYHRLCLHAASLELQHPITRNPIRFESPARFETPAWITLRQAIITPEETTAYRLCHGEWPTPSTALHEPTHLPSPTLPSIANGGEGGRRPGEEATRFKAPIHVHFLEVQPSHEHTTPIFNPSNRDAHKRGSDSSPASWKIERFADWLLVLADSSPTPDELEALRKLQSNLGARGVYLKKLDRAVRGSNTQSASPKLIFGEPAEDLLIQENSLRYSIAFDEGYSVGLFLDQRENRRRLATNHVGPDFPVWSNPAPGRTLLNTFAYTCGFSVASAMAGAVTTSLDLSRKYLDWGRRNFELNGLDHSRHDFIYGDVFNWLRRLNKKQRLFDTIVLDPPTFSQSRESGPFRAAEDFHRLVDLALPLLAPNGVLLCSTNAATMSPESFLDQISNPIFKARRSVVQQHYVPQPIDFPISRQNPGYLKTCWIRVGAARQ